MFGVLFFQVGHLHTAVEGLSMLWVVVAVANHTPGQGEGTGVELMHLLSTGVVHREVVPNLSINHIKLIFSHKENAMLRGQENFSGSLFKVWLMT